MDRYESPVERLIREAQERGEFDNLPGAGKPLTSLDGTDDPDWWVRGLIRREELDMTGALPPALALRKEAAGFPTSLVELRTEGAVREVLDDYNRRVRLDRLRPAEGRLPPLLAKTVDVEDLVVQWRALRAARSTRAAAGRLDAMPPEAPESLESPATTEGVERPEPVEQLPRAARGRWTLWARLLRTR